MNVRNIKTIFFCKSTSEYRSVNESDTCVGSILSRDNKVFEVCNFEKIEIMEDYFCNVDGEYFFSINVLFNTLRVVFGKIN